MVLVCAFCHVPYAREHRVVSHIHLRHWSPSDKLNEMFFKVPLTDFIEPGRKGRFRCRHCGRDGMTRLKTGDHICTTASGGHASCLTRHPDGKKLTKQDTANLFQVNERCSLCDLCGAQFSETVGLECHLLSVHNVASKRLQQHPCPTCHSMFPTRSRLTKHIAAQHSEEAKSKSSVCDFCGKAYPSRNTMLRHRQNQHVSGQRFACTYCPKKFYKRHLWITHTQRHLGQAPHQCAVCGKDFSCRYNLHTHQRIHSGERPYQCGQCPAAFAQKNSLDVHMKKHPRHPDSPAYPASPAAPPVPEQEQKPEPAHHDLS